MPNAPSTKSQDLPTPNQSFSGNNTLDGAGKNSFAAKAANYRPKNVFMEVVAATVSRFAARLIDLTTGKAYSANELIPFVEAGLTPSLNTVGSDLGAAVRGFKKSMNDGDAEESVRQIKQDAADAEFPEAAKARAETKSGDRSA